LGEIESLRRLGDAAVLHREAERAELSEAVMLVLAWSACHIIIEIYNGLN
jgi:hypothetical protein